MNGRHLEALDEICSPSLAPKLRISFTQFRRAFPDWHQELLELVADDSTVVARFRCTGFTDNRITRMWGLEDRGPECSNSQETTPSSPNSVR